MQVMFFDADSDTVVSLKKFAEIYGLVFTYHDSYDIKTGCFDVKLVVPEGTVLFFGCYESKSIGLWVNNDMDKPVIINKNRFRKVEVW